MKHQIPTLASNEPVNTCSIPAAAPGDQRWSDIMPDNSALIFAVLWDPDDEIVAFSNPDILDGINNIGLSPDSPSDACDSHSQVLTIGHSTIPLSENTATLAFFRDKHEFLFTTRTPPLDRSKLGHTQTSSTLEGFDVYLRGSMFSKAYLRDRQYSFLGQLADSSKFDPRASFATMWRNVSSGWERVSSRDDGRSQQWSTRPINDESNLCSAFSVTTTSTSNYISVEMDGFDDEDSASWSTLEIPNTPGFSRSLSFDQHRKSKGRLKKRRPADLEIPPAAPSDVLNRPCYNYAVVCESRQTCMPVFKTIPQLVNSLSLRKWRSSKEPRGPV